MGSRALSIDSELRIYMGSTALPIDSELRISNNKAQKLKKYISIRSVLSTKDLGTINTEFKKGKQSSDMTFTVGR